MPPKPAAKAPAAAPAGPALSPEQVEEKILLIQECTRLEEQRVSELAQFTALKEEKEQLNALWAAAKKSVDERRAELRAKRRAKDDLAEQHSVEIKVFKQRIKHLLFEHQADTTDTLTDGQAALKLGLEEHVGSERELKADRRDLKALLKEMETAHEEFVRTLKAEQDRAVTELRLEFERDTRELQAVYDDKMTRLREELNRGREEDIRSIERRKTKQIQALIASHEKAFNDIKLYYNEITHSNLDLIKSLKEEVEDLKKKEAGDEKVMYAIAQENKKVSVTMRSERHRGSRAALTTLSALSLKPIADERADAQSPRRSAPAARATGRVQEGHPSTARNEGADSGFTGQAGEHALGARHP